MSPFTRHTYSHKKTALASGFFPFFPNSSQYSTTSFNRTLAKECSKLDKGFEHAMAEEGLNLEIDKWPEY